MVDFSLHLLTHSFHFCAELRNLCFQLKSEFMVSAVELIDVHLVTGVIIVHHSGVLISKHFHGFSVLCLEFELFGGPVLSELVDVGRVLVLHSLLILRPGVLVGIPVSVDTSAFLTVLLSSDFLLLVHPFNKGMETGDVFVESAFFLVPSTSFTSVGSVELIDFMVAIVQLALEAMDLVNSVVLIFFHASESFLLAVQSHKLVFKVLVSDLHGLVSDLEITVITLVQVLVRGDFRGKSLGGGGPSDSGLALRRGCSHL
jgi:hypothetical protein